jgi:hypothetical protein
MILAGGGLGIAVLAAGTGRAPAAPAADPGLDLMTVPSSVADHYHAAATHGSVYSEVPCFCGCETMLAHRSLLDCFVRPQGGWEPHAAGCAVCLDESDVIRSRLADGIPVEQIRAEIVATYTGTAH